MPLPSLFNQSPGQPPHLTLFKRAQNRPFQKVNHLGISRIIFPTRKGTVSKQKDSKRYRTPFSRRKFTKLFRTMYQNYEQSFSTECNSGSQNPISYSASYVTSPRFKVFKYQPPTGTSDRPRSTVFTGEGCYQIGKSRIPRFLFKDIYCSQRRRWSTSSYKLRPLKQFVDKKSFKMDTLESVKEILRPGNRAVTLDIKDAYFHVPIHMKSRKLLRFLWRKKAFQFVVLPFVCPQP